DRVVEALLDPEFGRHVDTPQNRPFGIMSVAWDVSVATYSPELLGTEDARHGAFSFGKVQELDFASLLADKRLLALTREMSLGIEACRPQCRSLPFCCGGAPANNVAERGRFDVTDTFYCALTQIITTETVLRALDQDLI